MNLIKVKIILIALVLTGSGYARADLINVSYIEISNAKGTWLQVGEVIANDLFDNDVALTGFATAPDQWSWRSGPENAIDGNTAGNYHLNELFHDRVIGSPLTITFNSLQDLSSLQIFGRIGCCTNRDLYNVSFWGANSELMATYTDIAPGALSELMATYTDIAPGALVFVPEPATLASLVLGFIILALRRSKVMSKKGIL